MEVSKKHKAEIKAALKAWNSKRDDGLLDHWLLGVQALEKLADRTTFEARRLATNRVLLQGFDELKVRMLQGEYILRERFPNQRTQFAVRTDLSMSNATFNRRQDDAIVLLTTLLLEQEQTQREQRRQLLMSRLPNWAHRQWFGIDSIKRQLANRLDSKQTPFQMVISGIGGIGKSTLAYATAATVADDCSYKHIFWVYVPVPILVKRSSTEVEELLISVLSEQITGRNSTLLTKTQIQNWLKTHQSLVIIDNIEDEHDVANLLYLTEPWLNPSKVVITSRVHPENLPHVYLHRVDTLSREDCYALIRSVAFENNQTALAEASDYNLAPIYDRIGGNPLATKMIVGMVASMPLSIVLCDMPVGGFAEMKEMYRFIYQRAWKTLSTDAQTLLLMMPMFVEHGATMEQMQTVTEMKIAQLWTAIRELLVRSLLIRVSNSLEESRYTIHRLTDNFLQVDVLEWRTA